MPLDRGRVVPRGRPRSGNRPGKQLHLKRHEVLGWVTGLVREATGNTLDDATGWLNLRFEHEPDRRMLCKRSPMHGELGTQPRGL